MIAPECTWAIAGGRELRLGGGRPALMGVVNATPDSFSDQGLERTTEARVALARELAGAGADVIDIGGESGTTDRPAVSPQEETERVTGLISAVAGLGMTVSVDTYKPGVAAAAIAAGAAIVNDVSGLRNPELADICAQTGAGLILMHTRAVPKQRHHDRAWDGVMAADVERFLAERIELAVSRGMALEQIMLDPGPDFGKTPFQTVESLRAVTDLHRFGRPLLAAISRKDFVGAITQRAPRERGAGTLAALAFAAHSGMHMVRLHDIAAAADFLDVADVLSGRVDIAPDLTLAEHLRRQR